MYSGIFLQRNTTQQQKRMHYYYTVRGSQEHKTEGEKSYTNKHLLCDALLMKFQEQAELTYSEKKAEQWGCLRVGAGVECDWERP